MKNKVVFLSLVTTAALLGGCKPQQTAPAPIAPPKVEVLAVRQADVPVTREWVGELDGSDTASIQAQVTGYLLSQNYDDGLPVKKDQLLFQLDDRTFKAELEQAKANLAQAEAKLKKAELDVSRYTPLAKNDAISQQELDNAVQTLAAAKANVDAATAAVEHTAVNLKYTRITSPIDGIASLSNANVGELIGAGRGDLAVVSKINPIKAKFSISEQEYLEFSRHYKAFGEAKSDAKKTAAFELILADGSVYKHKGFFQTVDSQVAQGTGTLQMRVVFENPDFLLRPGQFARVRAAVREMKNAMLIPQRAVTEMQGIYLVAVVDAQNKVAIVRVEVGPLFGSEWVIKSGLKAGDKVVVEGTQKARDGSVVTPVPFVKKNPATEKKS